MKRQSQDPWRGGEVTTVLVNSPKQTLGTPKHPLAIFILYPISSWWLVSYPTGLRPPSPVPGHLAHIQSYSVISQSLSNKYIHFLSKIYIKPYIILNKTKSTIQSTDVSNTLAHIAAANVKYSFTKKILQPCNYFTFYKIKDHILNASSMVSIDFKF